MVLVVTAVPPPSPCPGMHARLIDCSAPEDDDDVDPSSPLPDDAPHSESTAPNLLFDRAVGAASLSTDCSPPGVFLLLACAFAFFLVAFFPFVFAVFEGAVAVVVVVVVMATTVVVVVVVMRGTGRLPPTSLRRFTPTVPAAGSSLQRILGSHFRRT